MIWSTSRPLESEIIVFIIFFTYLLPITQSNHNHRNEYHHKSYLLSSRHMNSHCHFALAKQKKSQSVGLKENPHVTDGWVELQPLPLFFGVGRSVRLWENPLIASHPVANLQTFTKATKNFLALYAQCFSLSDPYSAQQRAESHSSRALLRYAKSTLDRQHQLQKQNSSCLWELPLPMCSLSAASLRKVCTG